MRQQALSTFVGPWPAPREQELQARIMLARTLRDIEALCQQKPSNVVAFLLADVDHFKGYNDNYGHEAGDIALQQIGNCLVTTLEADRPVAAC